MKPGNISFIGNFTNIDVLCVVAIDEKFSLKTRDYLLEKRGRGHWRNTYESSLILETLLPDLPEGGSIVRPPVLSINGQRVPAFPYQARLVYGGLSFESGEGRDDVFGRSGMALPGRALPTCHIQSVFDLSLPSKLRKTDVEYVQHGGT